MPVLRVTSKERAVAGVTSGLIGMGGGGAAYLKRLSRQRNIFIRRAAETG